MALLDAFLRTAATNPVSTMAGIVLGGVAAVAWAWGTGLI